MDHRDVAGHYHQPYTVDEHRRVIRWEDELGNEVTVPLEWAVCETCLGSGSHVNPSIDAHGISAEEFDRDPDFAEAYFAGVYDVPCSECDGRRVVPTSSDPRFEALEGDAWAYALEVAHERAMGY